MNLVKKVKIEFGKRSTFTINDLRRVLGRNINDGYIYLLVHNLLASGEMKRIAKGVYTFKDELELVGFGFAPFYYGLQEALSLRNMWEQETIPIILTTKKVRPGSRKFSGNNYLIRHINRKMFFGFEMIKYHDFWIPVSDMEKTLIDFIYFKEPIQDEVLVEMKIRKDVLEQYLKRCPTWVKIRTNSRLNNLNVSKK
ncbi:MAG: hypothetical protein ABID61_03945 [Candidatus Micrarchaeota archaeon]